MHPSPPFIRVFPLAAATDWAEVARLCEQVTAPKGALANTRFNPSSAGYWAAGAAMPALCTRLVCCVLSPLP